MARVPLANFSKGEIAPALYGRIDVQQYSAALKVARNFVVQRYGGVSFRVGTRLVGEWDDPEEPVRLIPFQFSTSQSYVLVMGQGMMRPAALGGFVLEQNTKITAITLGYPTEMTVPFHGYDPGDRIYLFGIEGTTELNGRFATILTTPDANTLTLDIDSTGFTPFVSSDGTLNVSPPPPPPAPPPVPPPSPPPAPPVVGGGGGPDYMWWKFSGGGFGGIM